MKKKINKDTKFNEIFGNKEAVAMLEEKGMHCLGCPFASMESIEQGAKAHGLNADKLVRDINKKRGKKVKKTKTKRKRK